MTRLVTGLMTGLMTGLVIAVVTDVTRRAEPACPGTDRAVLDSGA